jgi:transmembrane sensor
MDRKNDVEESASDWLILRDSGRWTGDDQARFEQWLDASTLNRVTFLRLELAWEESARLKALGAGVPGDRPPPPGDWNLTPFFDSQRVGARDVVGDDIGARADKARPRGAPTRNHWRAAIAAGVFLAITAGVGAFQLLGSGERYTTPIGGIASVPILDGSKITLNTDSQVRVALSKEERRIDLKQGEAFFEVAKDPGRPFVVEAGGKRIVAVGTSFSVRREGESIEVIVTEGKVRLEDARKPLSGGGPGAVFLTPGSIALADDAGLLVERKSVAEAESHLSWRSGVLEFRELPLADAVAEFNRYNVRKIVIADPGIAALKVEGNFRPTNIDAFVRLLEGGFPVQTSVQDDRIVITSK